MSRSTPPESTPGSRGDGASDRTGSSPESAPRSVKRDGEDVGALRRLLLGEDRDAVLERLAREGEEDVDAEKLAELLPEAIEMRRQKDDALSRSLAQTIEEGLKASVERDPTPIIDVVFPVLGPAIRKAVRSTVTSLMERMNQAVTYGLSWKGLLWRVEAWRKGVSFGEIAIRHTLTYRVEQVLLLHRESGLLLRHVVDPTVELEDPALVSSMLTAISQFVEDSFDVEAEEPLDSIKKGDLSVLVEVGPRAALAAVVRGHPPERLRVTLRETLEEIHEQYRAPLATFSGDSAPLHTTGDLLRECLDSEHSEPLTSGISWKVIAILSVLLLLGGWWAWTAWQNGMNEREYLAVLREAPGIEILQSDHRAGALQVTGLRDPGAPDPEELIEGTGLDVNNVSARWLPYHSSEPEMVASRVARLAGSPDGATFEASPEGVVRVSGIADTTWAPRVRALLPTLDYVHALDFSGLKTPLDVVAERVEEQSIDFLGMATTAPPDAEMEVVRREVLALSERAQAHGEANVSLRIVGHTDNVGTDAYNRALSARRARAVRDALGDLEIPVEVVGRGAEEALAPGESPESRRVTFEVVRNQASE